MFVFLYIIIAVCYMMHFYMTYLYLKLYCESIESINQIFETLLKIEITYL